MGAFKSKQIDILFYLMDQIEKCQEGKKSKEQIHRGFWSSLCVSAWATNNSCFLFPTFLLY